MKPGEIPNFLKAESPLGLRRLMMRNNLKHRLTFVYSNFQFSDGDWYCWFYVKPEDTKDDPLLNEKDEVSIL